MLGTSMALTTASSSTSHMSAILRLLLSETGRSLRSTSASGWIPIERSAATECWVGLVFCSPDAPMNGTSDTCTKNTFLRPSSWRTWRADSMNGWLSMSPTVPPISVMITSGAGSPSCPGCACRRIRRLISSVMCGMTCTVSPRYSPRRSLRDHLRVDLPGRDVGRLVEVDVEEALVVADVEVGLGAVVGDEDLAVLERVHRARIDVQIGVELLHDDAQAARREQVAETRGGEALTERGDDAPGHEDVLGNDRFRIYPPRGFILSTLTILSVGLDSRCAVSGNRSDLRACQRVRGVEQLARVRERGLGVGVSAEQPWPSRRCVSSACTRRTLLARDRAVAVFLDHAGGWSRTPRPARGA